MSSSTVPADGRLIHFPISFFSIIMGLAGLTIAVDKWEAHTGVKGLSATLMWVVSGLFVVITLFYLAKALRNFSTVKKEFWHPIKLHFFPTISISFLLLSIGFLHAQPVLSKSLWVFGAALHLVFTLSIVSVWIQAEHFEMGHMNPSWFIPAVGNIIVPIAGVVHAPIEVSWFFFSIGLMFWIILLVIFFNRIIFHHPLPGKLLPTFFILIAPPAVGFIAYIKLTGSLDPFAQVLYYFGVFILLLLLVQIKLFAKVQFFLSWWAYSFPMAAITIASFLMAELTGKAMFVYVANGLLMLLVALIALLLVRTFIAISRGEICVED